tara:strand:+ start:174 stop:287 length:114 start_codon:yes stop_codon:yes gene_type:complete
MMTGGTSASVPSTMLDTEIAVMGAASSQVPSFARSSQ